MFVGPARSALQRKLQGLNRTTLAMGAVIDSHLALLALAFRSGCCIARRHLERNGRLRRGRTTPKPTIL